MPTLNRILLPASRIVVAIVLIALGTAMKLWLWTLRHIQSAADADGSKLYHKTRQGVTFPLADALCWLLAARQFILDVLELEAKGSDNPTVAEGLPGLLNFMTDLCHVQTARAAGEAPRRDDHADAHVAAVHLGCGKPIGLGNVEDVHCAGNGQHHENRHDAVPKQGE